MLVEYGATHYNDDFPTSGEYLVGFSLTLNDLRGGSATATIYSDEGGSFAPTTVKATYSSENTDDWDVFDLYYFLDRGSKSGAAAHIKFVLDITYPDNFSERIESNEMFIYSGTFITASGTNVTNTSDGSVLTMSFTIDSDLVDPNEIDLNNAYHSLFRVIDDDNSEYVALPAPTVERNGASVRFIYNLTDVLPPGQYKYEIALSYDDWEGYTIETFNID